MRVVNGQRAAESFAVDFELLHLGDVSWEQCAIVGSPQGVASSVPERMRDKEKVRCFNLAFITLLDHPHRIPSA